MPRTQHYCAIAISRFVEDRIAGQLKRGPDMVSAAGDENLRSQSDSRITSFVQKTSRSMRSWERSQLGKAS
jgi:hypothetical protein